MFQYCPACKSEKLTFEDSKYFTCPDCGFLYFHNVASAVGGLLVCGGELLMTVRAKDPSAGLLDLPGGFVDPGESLEEGLVRELYEELGVRHTIWEYLCSTPNTYEYSGILYQNVDSYYVATLDEKPQMKLEEAEIRDVVWVTLSALPRDEQLAFPSTKVALTDLQARLIP